MSGHRPFRELEEQLYAAHPEARAEVEIGARAMRVAIRLQELREKRKLTQVDLAGALKTTQANISRMEHSEDHYLSSLREYVEAIGGELELLAVFPEGVVRLDAGRPAHRRRRKAAAI
jgi:transcriptional regulator with XRE-family HTH domain